MIKVIRTREEYDAALAAIERLMDAEPVAGTPDADKLELLTVLVNDYEKKLTSFELPSAVDALRFRMEQQGLTQRDLIPYIGSKSKVSEVLAGKRPLSLTMIRAIHVGLGIPAKVLLQAQDDTDIEPPAIEWERFPVADMVKRGWLAGVGSVAEAKSNAERILTSFFKPVGIPSVLAVMYKRSRYVRAARPMNKYALAAWTARIMIRAKADSLSAVYQAGTVTPEFMGEVARLSREVDGPRLARDFLRRHGIAVVIEPHLPGTHLDGAAVLLDDGRPVIGMSVRYDRLDNFWFCLLHELCHISLHLRVDGPHQFIDDLDSDAAGSPEEEEADRVAGEVLVPEQAWRASAASKGRAPIAIRMLADELRIHPAIVAGKIRRQYNDYRVLNELVGRGEVRRLFPDTSWV